MSQNLAVRGDLGLYLAGKENNYGQTKVIDPAKNCKVNLNYISTLRNVQKIQFFSGFQIQSCRVQIGMVRWQKCQNLRFDQRQKD